MPSIEVGKDDMTSIEVDDLTDVASGFAVTLLSAARAHATTAMGRIGSVPLWFGTFQKASGAGSGNGFPVTSVRAKPETVGQGDGT